MTLVAGQRVTHCAVCGGLGVQVEVRPWGAAVRVCEAGHKWVTTPVRGTERRRT